MALDGRLDVGGGVEAGGVAAEVDAAAAAAGVPEEVAAQRADGGALAGAGRRLRPLAGRLLDLHADVAHHQGRPLLARGRRRRREPLLRGPELAEDPGVAAGAAGHQHEVAAGLGRHAQGVGRGPDVARAQHRDGDGALHRRDLAPVGAARVALGAGAAVERHRARAAGLGGAGHLDAVDAPGVPARADLHGDRDAGRLAHRPDRRLHRPRIPRQRGAGAGAADLLDRAGHVDVDDVGAAGHRRGRAPRQDLWLGGEDLHRERDLAGIAIEVALGLAVAVDEPVGRDHLGVGEGRAHLAAEEPERAIGDAGERRQEEAAGEAMGADAAWAGRRG